MADRRAEIRESYQLSKNIYDDVLTRGKWWSRLYIKLFWAGVDDCEIARRMLRGIPDGFDKELLDVPCGTMVFTAEKYAQLPNAGITCLDYSADMLSQAEHRRSAGALSHVKLVQGDVGSLPFEDGAFDIVLSMNGVHAFPDKERAWSEMTRVLKPGGKLLACFYIKGESGITDMLVKRFLARKGWFTPPFETKDSLRERLARSFRVTEFSVEGSMVWFSAEKQG